MHYRLLIIGFVFIFFISCGLKQPTQTTGPERKSGSLFVTSDPAGAQIILDGVDQGKITPDTLHNVPVGNHTVRLYKDGYETSSDSFIVHIMEDRLVILDITMEKIELLGQLKVVSFPTGGEILIDGQATGQTTPDTISLQPGNHLVEIVKNGYKSIRKSVEIIQDSIIAIDVSFQIFQRVLFESFANVSCIPCVPATENLLRFVENDTTEQYAIIEYFAYWPSRNDPFYNVAPNDINERLQYYTISGLPTLYLNGTVKLTNEEVKDSTKLDESFYSTLSTQNSPVGISVGKQKEGNRLSITVEVYDFDSGYLSGSQRLFVAIIENEIHLSEPPGSNGLKDFEYVFRGFVSDRTGDPVTLPATPFTFSYTIDWPNEWDYEHSHVVAFIQDASNKKVIQTSIN